jgi:D-Tyr-tRNAtyr deacylase
MPEQRKGIVLLTFDAAKPKQAIPLTNLHKTYRNPLLGKPVQSGVFGANMQVELCNDGPDNNNNLFKKID